MDNFIVISGCSGGGKSTLLEALSRRGHTVVPEPGRRIVAEELAGTGRALPWVDLRAFADRAVAMAVADRDAVRDVSGFVFFDRGLVDAAAALDHATGGDALAEICADHRYHPTVFMTPPWPEIFRQDGERQHALDDAVAEYERLLTAYHRLGYETIILPKLSVHDRVTFLLDRLSA